MSTTVTLRPNGATGYGASVVNTGGAASMQAALADNLDTTYVTVREGGVIVDFDTSAIPAGAQIRSVAARVKFSGIPFSASYVRVGWGPGSKRFGPYQSVINPPAGEYAFPAQTRNPDGNAWTQADIDALQIDAYGWSTWIGDDAFFYAMYLDVTYNEAPTATGTGPNGSSPTSRPVFTWTYSDNDSDQQERFRVKVVDANNIGAPGWDPNTATNWDADSGEVFSPYTSWQCNVDLKDGFTYRAYVWVSDAGSNGRYNAVTISGPYAYCTIAQEPPAVPTIEATYWSNDAHLLTVQDRQSILPNRDDDSLEASIGSWVADSGCTLSRSSTAAEFGSYKLVATSNAANVAYMSFRTGTTAKVTPGQQYSGRMAFRGPVTQRFCKAQIAWYDAGGTFISSVTGPARQSGNGSYKEVFVTGVAPANAVRVALVGIVEMGLGTPSGEAQYIDGCTLVPFEINIFYNPEFQFDINVDGIADYWSAVNAGGGGAVVTRELDFENVLFGVNSQKVTWTGSTGKIGVSQPNHLISGQSYKFGCDVYSEDGISNFYIDISGAGGGTFGPFTIAPGQWYPYQNWFAFVGTDGSRTISFYSTDAAGSFSINYAYFMLGADYFLNYTGNRFTFVRAGLLSSTRIQIQRSIDDGKTWTYLERPIVYVDGVPQIFDLANYDSSDIAQTLQVYDFEAPRGAKALYRTRAIANSDAGFLASSWSKWDFAYRFLPTDWLLQTLDAQIRCVLKWEWESFETDQPIDTAEFDPVDSDETIVLHGRARSERLSGTAIFPNDEEFAKFAAIRLRRETMLFQASDGRYWYVRFGGGGRKAPERKWSSGIERRVQVQFVEVRI